MYTYSQNPGIKPPIVVATMLTPAERPPVDAAGAGSYETVHRDSVDEVVRDLKDNRAAAVLLSVTRCDQRTRYGVAALVREFPTVPTVALVTQVDRGTLDATLQLGATGLRRLVDVRSAEGWHQLRAQLVAARGQDIQREALSQLTMDLSAAPHECRRFFEALFMVPFAVCTIRAFADALDVLPNTLMSRFFRAQLPAPKRYLATARLVRAARLFENRGFSIANIANHLQYSSPQSFGRHVQTWMDMTAASFRDRYDGEGMLLYFREGLVLPYLDRLRDFYPLTPTLTSGD